MTCHVFSILHSLLFSIHYDDTEIPIHMPYIPIHCVYLYDESPSNQPFDNPCTKHPKKSTTYNFFRIR